MFDNGAVPVFGLQDTPVSLSHSLGSGSALPTYKDLPDADWGIFSLTNHKPFHSHTLASVASFPAFLIVFSIIHGSVPVFDRSSASVDYTECNVKNKKRGRPGNKAMACGHTPEDNQTSIEYAKA